MAWTCFHSANGLTTTCKNMTYNEKLKLGALVKFHPAPWYLDRCNIQGVCVKDCNGHIVFEDDFGSIPDEMSSGDVENIIGGSQALARFLVCISEEELVTTQQKSNNP